jgi:hypothetical protein
LNLIEDNSLRALPMVTDVEKRSCDEGINDTGAAAVGLQAFAGWRERDTKEGLSPVVGRSHAEEAITTS